MRARPCLDCNEPADRERCDDCHRKKERERDRARGNSAARGYDHNWRRRVAAAIKAQPFCTYCGATEDLTGDHPVARARGGRRDQVPRVLCRSCNSARGATGSDFPF